MTFAALRPSFEHAGGTNPYSDPRVCRMFRAKEAITHSRNYSLIDELRLTETVIRTMLERKVVMA